MALSKRASSLLIVVLAALWLGSLGLRPLYKPDEGRYGEIPREMVASGDWLTPRLNGFKYFEKPPLQYWATAAAYTLFGVSDWAARLWTGLAALAGVWMAFAAGNRLFGPPAGAFAAAILASSPLYVLLGQANTLDMSVTLFLSAAVFAFALAQREGAQPRVRRRWMLAFWAACAGAVLSKGLIGFVLPAGAVALYVLVRRDWGLLRRLELLRGGLLFFALAAPWFVAVSLANAEFAYFFFVQEHWLRFTTKMHHRIEPAWFFLPVLVVGAWPVALRDHRRLGGRVAPPAGRVLAGPVPRLVGAGGARFLFRFRLEAAAVHPAARPGAGGARWRLCRPPDRQPLARGAGAVRRAGRDPARRRGLVDLHAGRGRHARPGGCVRSVARRGVAGRVGRHRRRGAAGGARASAAGGDQPGAGVLGALMVGAAGHPVFAPAYSAASLVASLPQAPSRDAAVFTVETYDHTIPWALRRTVTMVAYKDELAQAIGWEPRAFIPDLPGFARAWKGEREAYAFFAVRDFERLRRELDLPMEIAARGPRYVIVRKPQ